ncbi:MAG: hypothetical protein WBM40_23205 [Thiohalocapsa sp.]
MSCQPVGGVVGPTPHGRAGSSMLEPYRDRPRVTVDGIEQTGLAIPLIDDRQEHTLEVKLHTA